MDILVKSLLEKQIQGVATGFKRAYSNGDGTYTVEFVDGSTVVTNPIKGDKGDKGDKFVYSDFTTQELADLKGAKGDTGERGVTGVGITSVAKQGTSGLVDTYKIVFSDGSETTFDIVNGANVTKTSQLTNDSDFITNATIGLINYYLKDEVYNKAKIDELLRNVGAGLSVKIVSSLPTEEISGTTIYLINTSGSQYNQYMYIDGEWANLGSTTADLSSYYNKTQIDTMLLGYITASTLLTQLMQYTKTADLATVATSGSYNDLDDLPEIPSTDGFMKGRQSLGEVDLNDCLTEGVYTVTKTSSNLPDVDIYGTYCDLEVLSIQTVVNQQLRIVVGDDKIPMLWDRSKIGDTWTEWVHALSNKVTTDTIVDDNRLIPSSKAVYDALAEKPDVDDTTSGSNKVYSSEKVDEELNKRIPLLTGTVDILNSGFPKASNYYVSATVGETIGLPINPKSAWYLEHKSHNADYKYPTQVAYEYAGLQRVMYRTCANGVWSSWKQLANTDSANPLPYISTSGTNVLYYALTNIGKASDKTHLMRVTAISSSGSNVALFTYKHTTSNTKIVISSNNLTITAQNESGTIAYSSTPTRIIVEYIAQLD